MHRVIFIGNTILNTVITLGCNARLPILTEQASKFLLNTLKIETEFA